MLLSETPGLASSTSETVCNLQNHSDGMHLTSEQAQSRAAALPLLAQQERAKALASRKTAKVLAGTVAAAQPPFFQGRHATATTSQPKGACTGTEASAREPERTSPLAIRRPLRRTVNGTYDSIPYQIHLTPMGPAGWDWSYRIGGGQLIANEEALKASWSEAIENAYLRAVDDIQGLRRRRNKA